MSDDVVIVAVIALAICLLATIGALVLLTVGRARRRWSVKFQKEHELEDDEGGDV